MPSLLTFTTFLFFLLVIPTLFKINTSFAMAAKSAHDSLVLGLTHSRTPILTTLKQKTSVDSTKRPSELVDMMEPLRGVRDGYIISLNIGTPPQVIQVYMDTGSDLTWVPCGNLTFDCMDCDEYRNNKIMSTFSPSHSSTSLRESCSSPSCINIHSADNYYDPCAVAGCSLSTLIKATCSRPCPSFAYTYGAGGVVIGALTRDMLRVHTTSSPNVTLREVPKFRFGCVGSTYREPIGIVGFGRGPLSLPSQLGFLQKGFSHCFLAFKFANNPNMTSPLVIGDVAISSSNDDLQFTPMLKSHMYPNYYYIGLEAITVGNNVRATTTMPLSLREFDSQGNGGMLIDSGTTYTHLPEPLYSQLLSTIQASMATYHRANEVEARTGFDLCYKIPCPNNNFTATDDEQLPSFTFHFLNNVSLVLPRGNHFYAMGAPSNSTVVKCLLFQSMDREEGGYGPAGVFGSFQQQNVKVVYDLKNERIGFQPMDCAAAAAASDQGLHKN